MSSASCRRRAQASGFSRREERPRSSSASSQSEERKKPNKAPSPSEAPKEKPAGLRESSQAESSSSAESASSEAGSATKEAESVASFCRRATEEERKPAGVRPSGRGRERSSVIVSAAPRKASARSQGRRLARSQTIQGKERSWEREREAIKEKRGKGRQKPAKRAAGFDPAPSRRPQKPARERLVALGVVAFQFSRF